MNDRIKYILGLTIGVVLFSSCKKDYACLGAETVEYGITSDSTSTESDIKIQQDFQVFEACINCSNKDKQALLEMILDQLIREEEQAKTDFEEQGYYVKTENILESTLICEEKEL